MIIVIEGTDGSGKATQTKLLLESLTAQGYKCGTISFPNYPSPSCAPVKMYLGGELGQDANCLDAKQASSLFAVDRLLTMHNVDVDSYDYLILDRYTPSNMIHQACKTNSFEECDECLEWLDNFEYNDLKLPRPDKVVFLDVPVEVSLMLAHARANLKNGEKKDIHENNTRYMKKAYNCAKYVARKYNWDVVNCAPNGELLSIDEIHEKVLNSVTQTQDLAQELDLYYRSIQPEFCF